ncbi:hypothetical protein [Blautia sp.]|nr:hypothetical protein [uncultured Blautia sp.]
MEQDPDEMDFMGHAPFALKNRENQGKIREWRKENGTEYCFGNA